MQTAMDRFDEAMKELKAAQTAEAPLWDAVEAAGADWLAHRPPGASVTVAEAWFAARRRTERYYIEAMAAAGEVARKAGLTI